MTSHTQVEDPTAEIPYVDWSTEGRLASNFWFGMDAATRWAYIEKFGVEATAQLEFDFLRSHQEAHFLEGVSKLGLDDYPDHVKSAMYHCLSNLLGGLDMGYRGDTGDGKAWVFYLPPCAFATGPLQSTSAHGVVPREVIIRTFEAWQSNNGVLLNNDRLQFTLTDCVQWGGPYDAGYFSEADHPVKPEERYVIDFDQRSEAPGPPPQLSIASWPQGRREGALRKYAAEYALGGLAEIARIRGDEVAMELAETSHRNVLVAWIRPLHRHFGIHEMTGMPHEKMGKLFAEIFGLLGDQLEIENTPDATLLRHIKTRLRVPQYDGWETPPRGVEEAFARAWNVAVRAVGPEVRVEVLESRNEGAENTVWKITTV